MNRRGVLVSVRDAAEAEAALAGGAAVIDVKDPARGSLGAADAARVAEVAATVGDRAAWTVAAGELADGVAAVLARIDAACRAGDAAGIMPAAVKAGLAGLAGGQWREDLARLRAALPPRCVHVAVAYADFERAAAPAPADVIATAARIGCGMLLLDTSDKAGPGLLHLRPRADLVGWVREARRHGLGVAVAGRIALADIPAATALAPDLVALRGAVCSNEGASAGRLGRVSRDLVAAAVAGHAAAVTQPVSSHP